MFPRIRGTFLGVPIIGIIVYWGLNWGPLILGNYHLKDLSQESQFVERGFSSLSFGKPI